MLVILKLLREILNLNYYIFNILRVNSLNILRVNSTNINNSQVSADRMKDLLLRDVAITPTALHGTTDNNRDKYHQQSSFCKRIEKSETNHITTIFFYLLLNIFEELRPFIWESIGDFEQISWGQIGIQVAVIDRI